MEIWRIPSYSRLCLQMVPIIKRLTRNLKDGHSDACHGRDPGH